MRQFDRIGLSLAIAGRRKMRGLTVRQAAEQIHISPATLSRAENIDDSRGIELDTAVALCEWLELPMDSFVRRMP